MSRILHITIRGQPINIAFVLLVLRRDLVVGCVEERYPRSPPHGTRQLHRAFRTAETAGSTCQGSAQRLWPWLAGEQLATSDVDRR